MVHEVMKKNKKVWKWGKKLLPWSGLILFSLLLGFCLSLILTLSTYLINNKFLLTSINLATSLTTLLVTLYWFPKFNQFIEKRILRINIHPKDLVETYIARISTSLDRETIATLLIESVLPSFLIRTSALVWIEEESSNLLYMDGIAKESIPSTVELLRQTKNKHIIFNPYPINNHAYDWIQLIFPLRVNQRIIGYWCLGSKGPTDIFKVDEIKILKSIANHTAFALSNIQHKDRVDFLLQENIHRHEEERSKLARDLHDEVLNGLVVLGLTLDDNQVSPDFEKHYKSLTGKIRRMINGLRPPSLKQGLWYALEEKTEDMRQLTGNKINIEFNIPNSSIRYHPAVEGHLFRIIQQALDNAIQHSIADNIRVFGAMNPDSIILGVEDDGIGLPTKENNNLEFQKSNNHYGTTVMKERSELIDAELNLISEPERGTRVEVILNGIIHKQNEHRARIKAENSLKERKDSLKKLVDSASYGILLVNEFENFIYANPQAAIISGYASPELLQLALKDLVPAGEYQKINEWRKSQKEIHPSLPLFKTQIKVKTGEMVPLEMTLGKILWNGKQVGMAHFNDISAKIRIEEAQKQSEEILYKIFENTNEGIIIIDQDGDHLFANQHYSDITGYSIAELLIKNMKDLVVGNHVTLRNRLVNRFAGIKSPSPFETTIKKNDGTIIPVIGISTKIIWQGQPAAIGFIQDISAQRQAEEALRQSEDKFKAIVENANDGIFIADQGGRFFYTNQKGADITGYSIEELLTLGFQDLVHPVDLEKTQMRQTARIKGESVLSHYEVLIVLKDGSSKPIDINFSTLNWNNQPAVLAIIRDISNRRKNEMALFQTEEKFKTIVENASDGILVADGSGRLIYANSRAAEITGYHLDDLLETSLVDLAHTDDFGVILDRLKSRFDDVSVPSQHETRIVTKSGTPVRIEYTSSKTTWGGQPGVMVIIRNISERTRTEEILRNNDMKFKAIVDTSKDGILVGDEDGKYIYANARAAEITGYCVEELMNTTIKDLAHPDEYEGIINQFNLILSGGKARRQVKTRMISKNGFEIPVEITAARTSWNQRNAIIVTYRDIS